MATLDQVEKLREKANVSYDEAKAALEAANGDLLDALILLERQGKVSAPAGGGYYSSGKAGGEPQGEGAAGAEKTGATFGDLLRKLGRFCMKVIHKGNINTFEVLKGGESKAVIPVTVLVLLLLFAFWVTIPLIIVGLFFGLRYRFGGPDLGNDSVNQAMDSAAAAAEKLKKSVTEETK